MIKAIIFDCFGVIVTDSFGNILEEVKQVAPDKVEGIVRLVNEASKGSIEPSVHRKAVAAVLGISIDEYMNRLNEGEVKNQQLLDYIGELKSRYKIGLLSNVGRKGLDTRFTEPELSRYFDAVVVSGDIGFAKPEARAYEVAADMLGVRLEDCVMIDDREDYCQGAVSVGMKSILYKSFNQMKTELIKLIQ